MAPGGQLEPGERQPGELGVAILMTCLRAVLRPGSLWRETGHCEATSPLDSIVLQQLLPSTFSLPPTKGPSCPDSWRASSPPTSRDQGLLLLTLHPLPCPWHSASPERECGVAWPGVRLSRAQTAARDEGRGKLSFARPGACELHSRRGVWPLLPATRHQARAFLSAVCGSSRAWVC